MPKKILSVVGARPNFIKLAPLHRAFAAYSSINHIICHTGQHSDMAMSEVFFRELSLPEPTYNLGISGGSHAAQTAAIMTAFEKVMLEVKPDLVLVVGDVNSTLACSLVAAKLYVPVAHVEAGLRSNDRTMPEEINRILTDDIADMLFVTEKAGMENLKREGKSPDAFFFTGNVMIDSLVMLRKNIESSGVVEKMDLKKGNYILCTFHRPANVDSKEYLAELLNLLSDLSATCPVIFPVHPRTRNNIDKWNLSAGLSQSVVLTSAIGYTDFLALTSQARLILTDSGGIQEESTFLGVQCITVRDNTERPVTVEVGTNQLAGRKLSEVSRLAREVLSGKIKKGGIPELWDGKAAERIAAIIEKKLS